MEYTYSFHHILDTISKNVGVCGIFANPGFGKTTLMMQMIDEINKRKEGKALVIAPEMSRKGWIQTMQRLDIPTDRVVVDDYIWPSYARTYNILNTLKKVTVLCVDCPAFFGREIDFPFSSIANQFNIPVIILDTLIRDSGDYDPHLRPELFSIPGFRDGADKPYKYDFLVLMHRKHKCDRGIGTAYRYDIQKETELIIKRNWNWEIGSVFIEWDETASKFIY